MKRAKPLILMLAVLTLLFIGRDCTVWEFYRPGSGPFR